MYQDLLRNGKFAPDPNRRSGEEIQSLVADLYGVPFAYLRAAARGDRRTILARHVAMYLMHVVLGASLREVGRAFGRDRTTVWYACRRIENLRDDPALDQELMELENLLAGALESACEPKAAS